MINEEIEGQTGASAAHGKLLCLAACTGDEGPMGPHGIMGLEGNSNLTTTYGQLTSQWDECHRWRLRLGFEITPMSVVSVYTSRIEDSDAWFTLSGEHTLRIGYNYLEITDPSKKLDSLYYKINIISP